MLTVCWRLTNGNEVIFEAQRVERWPDHVTVIGAEGDELPVYEGPRTAGDIEPMLFVMNEAGKTVARYTL
jgi:hypothetical protein